MIEAPQNLFELNPPEVSVIIPLVKPAFLGFAYYALQN
jgi:hypothetical protein